MPRLVELLMSICQKLGLIQDFVVETGTSNGWNYRKWNSGRAECWITFTQSIAPYAPISGMYAFNPKRNYPFEFKSIDSINFNADINDYFAIPAGNMYGSRTLFNCYAIGFYSGTLPVRVSAYVNGKWK